jgi:hypothetical protein
MIDPSNPSNLEHLLQKYIWQEMWPFSTRLSILPAGDCFESITGNGIKMILFLPDNELILNDEILDEALKFHMEAMTQPAVRQKRATKKDISSRHHA